MPQIELCFFSPYGPFVEKSAFDCRKSRNPRVETPPSMGIRAPGRRSRRLNLRDGWLGKEGAGVWKRSTGSWCRGSCSGPWSSRSRTEGPRTRASACPRRRRRGLAPRRAQVPLRRVRPGGDGRGGLPRPRRRRGARGGAGRGEGGIVSRRPSEEGQGRRAERDQGIDFPQGRRALIQARVQTACAFFHPHISIHTHARICAYTQPHIFVLRICAITHLHIWVDTDTGCGPGSAMDDHGGMAYGKERFRRESGRHGEDDGRR